MKIIYVAWKTITCSDIQRILYKIQNGKSNTADQAIQNFNIVGENPGLWGGFTNYLPVPRDPNVFELVLENSKNNIKMWQSDNSVRKNPIKINMCVWDHKVIGVENPVDHADQIVETWYIEYMKLTQKVLEKLISKSATDPSVIANADTIALKDFIQNRLAVLPTASADIFQWILDTQDGFAGLNMQTDVFLNDDNLKKVNSFISDYFYLVIKYIDDAGIEKNAALTAYKKSSTLHPVIKNLLQSAEFGGEIVSIVLGGHAVNPEIQEYYDKLMEKKNVILYGAPGTGKTRIMTQIIDAFMSCGSYDPWDNEAPIYLSATDVPTSMKWCTFHPGYTYESFVWGLTPVIVRNKLGYSYHKGAFLKQAKESKNGYKALLVIDEINRANTDDVFGDTIQLLDTKNRSTTKIILPNEIKFDDDSTMSEIACSDDFYVIGTMNSLDKSVAPLVPEIKRIFSIIEIGPDAVALENALRASAFIPSDFTDYLMASFNYINNQIRENVGKEYMLGQGYIWDVVNNDSEYEKTFADIIRFKILPHLKDIFPEERYLDLFGASNQNILFIQTESVCEICNVTSKTDAELINAFAIMCGSSYRSIAAGIVIPTTFDDYDSARISEIFDMLKKYKNVMLAGVTGTGKSYILKNIMSDGFFEERDLMYWHNSTAYDDVIEGISAESTGTTINYEYKKGVVKKLAEKSFGKISLMGIENVDKSGAGENFGELITLLEPDKRESVAIEGYEGVIRIPQDMYFLCTSKPLTKANNKMDSALKRRFIIKELYPDYKLLQLWFGVDDIPVTVYADNTRDERLKLAIAMLKSINDGIAECVGLDSQIGHAVIWDLKDTTECSLDDIFETFDETILPMIEEICVDEDNAHRILGQNSPLIVNHNYGIELQTFGKLVTDDDKKKAIKEMLHFEI